MSFGTFGTTISKFTKEIYFGKFISKFTNIKMEFTLKTLREKCPYSELFWSDHNKIQTRITPNQDTFYAVKDSVVYPTDLKMKETSFKEFYRAPGANDF